MTADATPLIRYEMSNDVTVGTIDPSASLDAVGAKTFGDAVSAYVQQHSGVKLLLDFQHITYMSSSALSELLRIQDAAKAQKGSVRLCGLSSELHKVFEVTNLADVFKVNPDEDAEVTIMRLNRDSQWDVYPA
ncbi:MAG: STAS domain-containing protein [Candidatus Hydrogenedentes bacterium]|nr:STAS domain-containing protein [Candidatus Hydrogenedentota bacterium]